MSDDLDEAERIHGAATPGPWQECGHERGGCKCGMVWSLPPDALLLVKPCRDDDVPTPDDTRANAKAIAHAHNILPALIVEVRALREENAKLTRERDHLQTTLLISGVAMPRQPGEGGF